MKLDDLRSRFADRPLFRHSDLRQGRTRAYEYIQLSRWVKSGQVMRLKRGLYTLPEQYRRAHLSPLSLAQELYWPSYISLEYAMSYYGLIPEAVWEITCVTARKTMRFSNDLGVFSYRHVKKEAFFGFRPLTAQSGQKYFLADAEKCLLDFIYLKVPGKRDISKELLLGGYRLHNLERLNMTRLKEYIDRFPSDSVRRSGKTVLAMCRGRRK